MTNLDCVTHHHACDCREERFAMLEMRVKAAEKLLNNLTAADLCGENTWAIEALDRLLREFWDNEQNAART